MNVGTLPSPAESGHSHDEWFRLLVEQLTEYAIFVLDPTGRIATWNAGAERLKGYRAEEIIGQHFSRFFRAEDRWKCQPELETATRDGRTVDEGWRVRKDGSLFWANVVVTCLRDGNGRAIGFAKVTRDMTERHKNEESLRASEERFRLLVECVKDYAIFMLDPRGVVATWNVGAERLKGYKAAEIIGHHFSRFYSAEDVKAGKCENGLQIAIREGRFEDEGWRTRKDGSVFWANVVITALRDASGRLFGFAKVTRDLTERRRAEEERMRLGQLARARIRVLEDLAEALVGALSVEDVGLVAIEKGMAFAQADTCTLHSLDEAGMTLELVAERGCNPNLRAHVARIGVESDNPVRAIGLGEAPAVWIESAEAYQRFYPSLAGLKVEGARVNAFCCVPLVAEGRTIGILGMGFHAPRHFDDDEREFVLTFARQCAQALARARRLATERTSVALAERLRVSLSTTVRSIADAVITTDANGVVTLMNGVAEALTGWSERDGRGRPLADVFRIVKAADDAAETDSMVLVARDGREVAIEESRAPIRGEAGVIEGAVLVFRDVTHRKREEANRSFLSDATSVLAESLDYEVTVARVAQLAVPRLADWCAVDLVTDPGCGPRRLAVTHADPVRLELAKQIDAKYPQRPPQVLQTGRAELYPIISDEQLGASAVDEEHLRMLRQLQLRSAMVIPLVSRRQVVGVFTLVFAESGRTYTEEDLRFGEELARRCANAIENARLYASEQQARRSADLANAAKDEFLAVVSHELRTPLNAILGWAKLLAERDFEAHRRQRAFETIERNAVAMGQLIEDLLDMSRVISGKMRLEVQQVDFVRVLEAAIQSIQPAAVAKGIELRHVVSASVPSIMGDPIRLQQIVWNLLSNAVKFTGNGGRVEVDLRYTASTIEVSVSDTGKGIAAAFLPHVFDAFRQEDASSSRSRGGLGLGLAITRQLVELHGGRIEARSDGEGRGASFSVSLPVTARPPSGAAAASTGPAGHAAFERPAHLRGLHVLVVDDDEDARELVATILRECGCEITTVSNVQDAMRALTKDTQVLLSDVAMPGEDGFELIKRVRALPREQGGDIPAAALTAFARPEDRRRLLNAGFSIHLPKPLDPAEVVAVVATLGRFPRRSD
jgi:PAS domain S-box-containing protein